MLWATDEDLWLTLGDTRLEARCWGPPPSEAPTLVLLHEGLGCVALWRDFPEKLAAATGLGVFAYSRQGYGASDACALPRPVNYMEREAEQVLGSVLDAAGIRDAILVGHSDGGSIAALYGGGAQDPRVRGLVLMAPHFFVEDISVKAIRAAQTAYETGDLRHRLARYHLHVDVAFRGWNEAWLNPEFRDWDITEVLPNICVPILAIQGKDDPYGTEAQVEVISEKALAAKGREIVLIDDCEHAPHLEQQDFLVAMIADFVGDLD